MNPATIVTALAALGSAGAGCAAVAAAVTPRDPGDPGSLTEDRYRGDTPASRVVMTALAVAGSGSLTALACAGQTTGTVQAGLGGVAVVSLSAWLILGGRLGYDLGARTWCTGTGEGSHLIARGSEAVWRQDGTALCGRCALTLATAARDKDQEVPW